MTSNPTTSKPSRSMPAQTFLNPIRYPIAANHLQAKFSLPAALAMIALARKAGKREFSDEFVGSAPMQAMQKRITTELDPEIEKMGFDKMRSRIVIRLKNGRQMEGGPTSATAAARKTLSAMRTSKPKCDRAAMES